MPSIQNAESPLQCSRCGSQWFAEQEYCQYANQSYQSARRGPMVAMSDPQVARVCPCGMPFRPKRTLRGRQLASADQSFLESWEQVQKYLRLQSDAEERIGKRLREVVNAEYVQQLLARVESAEQEVVRLTAELQARHLKPRKKAPPAPIDLWLASAGPAVGWPPAGLRARRIITNDGRLLAGLGRQFQNLQYSLYSLLFDAPARHRLVQRIVKHSKPAGRKQVLLIPVVLKGILTSAWIRAADRSMG